MNSEIKKLVDMFWVFFRIGAFTIGGGLAMLPLIEKEVVQNKKWISEEEIVDIFAVSQSTPGVIAINSSIFVGYKIAGLKGSIVAALGVIVPSFVIILVIAYILFNINENPYLEKAFTGVRAGVTALILLSSIKLGKSVLKNKFAIIVSILAFIAMVVFDIHAILLILSGALLGYIYYRIWMVKKNDIT